MDFHISLIGRKDLNGEIYRQIRQAILEGRLRPCDALPPTRELARRLNVSRMTVTVAYERLAGEGFVDGRLGNNVYRERHELLTNTLTRDFADQLELIPCANGLHVAAVARFASVEQIDVCVDRAYEAGVAVQKLSTFAAGKQAMAGFVLGYGAIPATILKRACGAFDTAW